MSAINQEAARNVARLMRDVDELRGEERSAPIQSYSGTITDPLLNSQVVTILGNAGDYYNGFEAIVTNGTLVFRVISANGVWMAQQYSALL